MVEDSLSQAENDSLFRLFDAAVAMDAAARTALLAQVAQTEPRVATRLGRLLQQLDVNHDFLESAAPIRAVAQALATFGSLQPAQRIGAYEVIEAIGNGGMGRVYRAKRCDGEVEQLVAIKVMRPELVNPDLLLRFSTERQLLASLSHPGICRFLDAGSLDDGIPFVVMAYIDGESLIGYCNRRQLGLTERIALLRKIGAALSYAHSHLVVHRDIKSDNILVDQQGEPHLLDFGIAKWISPSVIAPTAPSAQYFTPSNAAPEQLSRRAVGIGVDVYQFGVLAYELLSGATPYDLDDASAGEWERAILQVPPAPMSQRARNATPAAIAARGLSSGSALEQRLRGDLDAVVAKCLRKDPHERYASIAEVRAELERILMRRPVKVRGGERWYRLRKFVHRHKVASALSALLLLTVATAALSLAWFNIALREQRDQALLERDRAQEMATLLRDSFAGADPARSDGADLRLRDVLAVADQRIAPLRDTYPSLFVTLGASLADVKLALGMDAEGATLAQQALTILDEQDFDADPERMQTRRQLQLLAAAGRAGEGDLQTAAQLLDQVESSDSSRQVDWAVAKGSLLIQLEGQNDLALSLLQWAVDQTATALPTSEIAVAARLQLADAYRWTRQYDDGLAVLKSALAWAQRTLPSDHPTVIRTRLARVDLLRLSTQYRSALSELDQIIADVVRLYGPDSVMAARAYAAQGSTQYSAQNVEAAIVAYRKTLETWQRSLGSSHQNTIRATFNLAMLLSRTGADRAEAEALFQSAVQAGKERFGPESEATHFFRAGFASFLLKQDARRALQTLAVEDLPTDLGPLNDFLPNWLPLFTRIHAQACATRATPELCATAQDALARVTQHLDQLGKMQP